MKVTPTALPEVLLVEPDVFGDSRGFFLESFHAERYRQLGIPGPFVQDNVSKSRRGVLRGLHFQHPHGQGKLVSVIKGELFDVAVDVRPNSPTFGKWVGEHLSDTTMRQLYIPPGFAHGFLALSDEVLFTYKCTDFYDPKSERAIRWNDPAFGIVWPMTEVSLSDRDANAPLVSAIDPALLPTR